MILGFILIVFLYFLGGMLSLYIFARYSECFRSSYITSGFDHPDVIFPVMMWFLFLPLFIASKIYAIVFKFATRNINKGEKK